MFGIGKKKAGVAGVAGVAEEVEEVEEVEVTPEVVEEVPIDKEEFLENVRQIEGMSEADYVDTVTDKKQQEGKEKENEEVPLSYKEFKALKKCKYETKIANNPRFKNIYVLKNKRNGMIVEIRAASSFHACNIIGWKSNRVSIIEEKIDEIKIPVPETKGGKEVKKEVETKSKEEPVEVTCSSSS